MTQEEAIEIINRNCTEGSQLREACAMFIPELEESEDERIRKWISLCLDECVHSDIIRDYERDECLAYLEKQKEPHYTKRNALFDKCVENCEPKTVEEVNKRVDDIMNMPELSAFEQALTNFIGYWEDDEERWPSKFVKKHGKHILDMAREELRKEQEPAEWSEEYREEDLRTRFAFYTYKDEDSVLYLSNVFVEETSRNKGFGTKILKAAEKVAESLGLISIRLKVKQNTPANAWYRKHGYGYVTFEERYDWLEKNLEYLKPAKSAEWSEEDKDYFDAIIAKLEVTQDDAMLTDNQMDFLKSLPERFNLQSKQEWSEEDEKMLRTIISDGSRGVELDSKQIDFLKSLRPQLHWKPNEEQILAIVEALKYLPNNKEEWLVLENLMDNLRTL